MNTERKIIKVKTAFSDWREVNFADALEWAKWKFLAITMGKTDEERLGMINSQLDGIQFSLRDLSNKYAE